MRRTNDRGEVLANSRRICIASRVDFAVERGDHLIPVKPREHMQACRAPQRTQRRVSRYGTRSPANSASARRSHSRRGLATTRLLTRRVLPTPRFVCACAVWRSSTGTARSVRPMIRPRFPLQRGNRRPPKCRGDRLDVERTESALVWMALAQGLPAEDRSDCHRLAILGAQLRTVTVVEKRGSSPHAGWDFVGGRALTGIVLGVPPRHLTSPPSPCTLERTRASGCLP